MTALFTFLRRKTMGAAVAAGLLGLLAAPAAQAQSDSLRAISRQFAQYSQRTLVEQLFLHLDRPAYAVGETLWFSVYAVDGTFHRPLALSKVVYVEVLDEEKRPVLQTKIAMENAAGQGSLVLPATLVSGRYVVRAYTRWMQNFSPEFYFQSPITILNTARVSTAKPGKSSPDYDIQFFPEGGSLVQGIASRVGFKAVDKMGKSHAVAGTVVDARGASVTTFKTLKFGLGSFVFTPAEAGAGYSAVVKLPDNTTLTSKLPVVQARGYVLALAEDTPATLRLTVQANLDGAAAQSVFMLGHTGQQVVAAVTAQLVNGQAVFAVRKRDLLPGITHFTVFDNHRQPVCERLYFQPGQHQASVAAQVEKPIYGQREKVSLQLSAPQKAAVSVAVYQLDSFSAASPADISSYLELAAELRGFIETPGYYFHDSSAVGREAADNLMLTQGWSRFRWSEVLAVTPSPFDYLPELNGPILQAKVTNAANGSPAPDITTYLTSVGHTGRFYHATSQANGRVQFELNPFFDTQKLVVQTNPQRDSSYRVDLLSPFSAQFAATKPALLVLTQLPAGPVAERHLQTQVLKAYGPKLPLGSPLSASDTVAFYGKFDEQYLLDDYTRFKTMEEVLREYVVGVMVRKRADGYHFVMLNRVSHMFFQENPLVLLDGVPVFNINEMMAFDPLKIKRVDLLTSRYYQGSQSYEGVASFTTYTGDMAGFNLNAHALLEEYEGLQSKREFYAPRYETAQQKQSRLPDLRNLLYWNPRVAVGAGSSPMLEFYTSDQTGRYVVVAQGMTANGPIGSTSVVFEIKPTL